MTAVEWLFEQYVNSNGLISIDTIKQAIKMERDQHGNTWDAAIKAHDDRGHVFVRSTCDFDNYEIK